MTIRDEDRAEADRLKRIPRNDQRIVIAMHWAVVSDGEVSAESRREARRRAKALESLLKITIKRKR
jgi:hypothetical protein